MGRLLVLILAVGSAAAAVGHDVWPAPTPAAVAPGELVRVELALDDGAGAREWLPRPASPPLLRFAALAPGPDARAVALVGLAGARPAGAFRPDRAGTWIVVYESTPRDHQLSAEHFERYLEEEGLTRAVEQRRARGETDLPARERWSRHTKALIRVGAELVRDRDLGLELELTLVEASATELRVRVSAGTHPIVGALVDLRLPDTSSLQARSADDGVVVFPCRPGPVALTTTTLDRQDGIPAWRGRFASLFLSNETRCTPSPHST